MVGIEEDCVLYTHGKTQLSIWWLFSHSKPYEITVLPMNKKYYISVHSQQQGYSGRERWGGVTWCSTWCRWSPWPWWTQIPPCRSSWMPGLRAPHGSPENMPRVNKEEKPTWLQNQVHYSTGEVQCYGPTCTLVIKKPGEVRVRLEHWIVHFLETNTPVLELRGNFPYRFTFTTLRNSNPPKLNFLST